VLRAAPGTPVGVLITAVGFPPIGFWLSVVLLVGLIGLAAVVLGSPPVTGEAAVRGVGRALARGEKPHLLTEKEQL